MQKLVHQILFRGVPYIGVGFLSCALFLGPQMDWSSAWTYAYLLAWIVTIPVTVFVASAYYAAIVAICAAAIGLVAWQFRKHVTIPKRQARIRKEMEARRRSPRGEGVVVEVMARRAA